jgi:predicted PurR-regulated permease PerM
MKSISGICGAPFIGMSEAPRERSVNVSWRTLLKIVLAVAVVWLVIHLIPLLLLVVVSVILAITLDPVVQFVERRGVPCSAASAVVGFTLLLLLGGCAVMTWSSLTAQARLVATSLTRAEHEVIGYVPLAIRNAFGIPSSAELVQVYIAPGALLAIRTLTTALFVFLLAYILTIYLLIEGRRTYRWLIAFAPPHRRPKLAMTAQECRRVIRAYVAGNIATSLFAAAFVFTALTVLRVPAALLLALLAGLGDFVPVLGFIVSVIPALVLALTRSTAVAVTVLGLYCVYHVIENYYIAPKVYGDRLKLSNVAVILAFAIGAELAGVVGALIALPIAAVYPAVERIWLREQLGDEVLAEHARIEKRAS